jgi:F420-non-reducing hydrogenase iron-sulfur subunit
MIEKSVQTLSEFNSVNKKILVYACNGCAYPAIDQATRIGYELPENLYIIRVPCSGRIDTQFVEYALTHGFSGVMIGMCETNSCHYIGGNEDCCKRIDLLIPLLEAKGISKDRVMIAPVCFSRGEDFIEAINTFQNKINTIGGDKQ